MQNAKRIEIITGAYDMREVIRVLDQAGLSSYTLIPDIQGKGERGTRDAGDLTEAFKNSMLIVVCSETHWEGLKEKLRLVVERLGGMVIASDCELLKH
jgi:nitrogen regulatory protein PII